MDAEGVLVTGVYGTGKSSVVEELADLLEDAGLTYGAIDLDWLQWFDAEIDDAARARVFQANLAAVVDNYMEAGVARFLMAGAVRDAAALAALRETLPLALRVVRLTVPLDEIERRLTMAATAGRADDLRVAKRWMADSTGAGIEDLIVPNDRPLRETALEILAWLGWTSAIGR